MAQKNISQKFRLKIVGGPGTYFIEETNQNDLMSKKHKKVCTALNYIEDLLISASVATGCVSFSAFAYLVGVPISIRSSAAVLKIYAITSGIKKYDN